VRLYLTHIIHLFSPIIRPPLTDKLSKKLPPVFKFLTETDPLPRGIVVKNPLEEEHHIISLCFRKESVRFLPGIFTIPRYVSDFVI
jgi:hypothetical protein